MSLLMSTSVVSFRGSAVCFSKDGFRSRPQIAKMLFTRFSRRREVLSVVNARKKGHRKKGKKKPWWKSFFLDNDGESWLNWVVEEVMGEDVDLENSESEDEVKDEKFEVWKSRAEAIVELREAQEGAKNEEGRAWEDWLGENGAVKSSSWDKDWDWEEEDYSSEFSDDPEEVMREKGLVRALKDSVSANEDELLFEDRVFRFASTSSAKFLAILILVPWVIDFAVHDYVLMPFLDRYVKTVPLAAELLDVRREQKLEMIKDLKLEKARFRLELEVGKSPPLSDDELWFELRHKAIELRDEWRLRNRSAFANILSDMAYGITLFILIYFNESKVALLKFTGYKLLNNISDTGKAFLIILITDIFLGYHSESGWNVVVDVILEHYGLVVDEAGKTIFISVVPVVIDACVKLWLFKFLPRFSPNVSNIFREMKRH